ncbi:hypothetical protein [Cloacibacillus porcorum]|uniref:hypothetical protein n=1 Tax=Cloacibacillus porcorum TaxID=1197717 RepID=UPI0025909895|nr:hypothetical protein [Cloacibacillus porcorum]
MTNRKNIIKITKEAVVWALVMALTLSPFSVAAEANYNAGGGTLGSNANYAIVIGADDANTNTVANGSCSVAVGALAVASGDFSSAYGYHAQATGMFSSAYGVEAKATAEGSAAYGYNAEASGKHSSAYGNKAQATGSDSSAFGRDAQATSYFSSAFGRSTRATGYNSSAFGSDAEAMGHFSSAFGNGAKATAEGSSAYGNGAHATGESSSAYGNNAQATAFYSSAYGYNAVASADCSSAYGVEAKATGNYSAAYGYGANATGESSSAYGNNAQATAFYSSAYGYEAKAEGKYSSAYGSYAKATGESSSAFGDEAQATAFYSSAYGNSANATGRSSSAFGNNAIASGDYSAAYGNGAEAKDKYSSAFGNNAIASGDSSSAYGSGAHAMGESSSAYGYNAQATAIYSSAYGVEAKATGWGSSAYGYKAVASADLSSAYGYSANATGLNSSAYGYKAIASGNDSSAYGSGAKATGWGSSAYGNGAQATALSSSAYGYSAIASADFSVAYGSAAQATADFSAAYGSGAEATVAYGVALGTSSTADRQTTATGVYVPTGASSTAVNNTVKGDYGVASIGDGSHTRQLAGVAAGIEDTDAVNVAQLKTLDGIAVKYESEEKTAVTFGDSSKAPVKLKNVEDADLSEKSTEAVTGRQLFATNQNISAVSGDLNQKIKDISVETGFAVKYDDDKKTSVTLGGSMTAPPVTLKNVADADLSDSSTEAVTGKQLFATNQNISAVSGDLNQKINNISVETGFAVKYDDDKKTSVTFGDVKAPVKLKNVAAGTSATEAVNYGQLSELDAKVNTLGGTVAERMGGAYDQNTGRITITYPSGPTPPANSAAAPSGPAANAAIPGGDPTLNETLQKMWDSIQANSVTAGENISVEGGKVSVVKNPEFESVRVGAVDITREGIDMGGKKITGLADGGIYNGSRDAVNGGQLWNAYNRIEELDNDIRVAGAHAAALSAMHPIAYNPYEPTTISAGYGYYRSEQSFAVGVFHYIRENVLVNAGMAFNSNGDTMGRAGVSFALGKSGRKQPSMIKDVNEMQKQMAAMQEMLMQLKEENEKNKEENRKNKEENRKNREIIKELKEALKEK